MSLPTLTPSSTLSAVILPITGTITNVNSSVPYKIYSAESSALYSGHFLSGAVDQVSYVYKKLGGDILDIELTEGNVYAAYEEAVLEYSYLINVHQATNILGDSLGNTTGSFDSKGLIMSGALSSSLGKDHVALRFPKFDYGMSRNISEGVSSDIGLGHSVQYSASFDITQGVQDYNLQTIISSQTSATASATITISNHANLAADDTIEIITTDGTTTTGHADTTTSTDTNSPTFDVGDGSNNATATNLATALNANSKITATAEDNVVTIKQVTPGGTGNTTITLTDAGDAGMTKTNFTGGNTIPFHGKIDGKRILIKKVYYKTPHAMWRFFGYYGGLNVVGNLSNYGQFSDDSTFQLVPAWQNKSQALAFEDAIYTRMSHYSYELRDNKLRLYPIPYTGGPTKMYVEFSVPADSWDRTDSKTKGVNNMNTLPIGNLPFVSINSIGKQWIRRFALAICKEMLGQVRSKFGSVPIPGDNVTLNGAALISEGKDEQTKLRDELKTTLAELTYQKIAEQESAMMETAGKTLEKVPYYIYVG